MAKADRFIQQELASRLVPDEKPFATGFLFNKSPWLAVLLGPLALLGSGYFFAAVTPRRLFLIKTRMGLFGVKVVNDGVIEIPHAEIRAIGIGGFLNQQTIKLSLRDGSTQKYKLNTRSRTVAGQKRFIDMFRQLHAAATHLARR